MTRHQFGTMIVVIILCTLAAMVVIPALTTSKYNPSRLFDDVNYGWIKVTYFNGDMDTINVTLSSPEIDALYLNTKGCIVREKNVLVESIICGVREFKVLTKSNK